MNAAGTTGSLPTLRMTSRARSLLRCVTVWVIVTSEGVVVPGEAVDAARSGGNYS